MPRGAHPSDGYLHRLNWRALAEQGHWLYDTAHERVRVTLEPAAFRVWVPAEEP